MKVQAHTHSLDELTTDALLVGIPQGTRAVEGPLAAIDRLCSSQISCALGGSDFRGSVGSTQLLYTRGTQRCKRVILVGLGDQQPLTGTTLRRATASGLQAASRAGLSSVTLDAETFTAAADPLLVRACIEGLLLGAYRFDQFRSAQDPAQRPVTRTAALRLPADADPAAVRREIRRTEAVCQSVCLARDLVSSPASSVTPTRLADEARQIARTHGLRCQVLGPAGIARLKMGALQGVAQGSDEPARFIVLEHCPTGTARTAPIVLVGKAITFDSGGISLKPPAQMDEMRMDMAGGAAVLATLQACAAAKLKRRVVGIVPATENLPSGHAYRPGDVLTAMSGKTIEIMSTDAEGRLVLADALWYARRFKPAAIIDLATLTGSCIIALGDTTTAIMGNDQPLIDRLLAAGQRTDEKLWQLPLWPEYREQIKGDMADIKNTGGRPAGTITAGWFLREFVDDRTPWAHLDIAGSAWSKKQTPVCPKGATGVGVRLLVDLLEQPEG